MGLTYALPLAHPTILGTHHGDHSIRKKNERLARVCAAPTPITVVFIRVSHLPVKVVAGAVIDIVLVVFHAQKILAVVASVVLKLIECLLEL